MSVQHLYPSHSRHNKLSKRSASRRLNRYSCIAEPCSNVQNVTHCNQLESSCVNTGLYGKTCRKVAKIIPEYAIDTNSNNATLGTYQNLLKIFNHKYTMMGNHLDSDFYCFLNTHNELTFEGPERKYEMYFPGDQRDFVAIESGFLQESVKFDFVDEYEVQSKSDTGTSSIGSILMSPLANQTSASPLNSLFLDELMSFQSSNNTKIVKKLNYPIFKFTSTGTSWKKNRIELNSCFTSERFVRDALNYLGLDITQNVTQSLVIPGVIDTIFETNMTPHNLEEAEYTREINNNKQIINLLEIKTVDSYCPASLIDLSSQHQYSYKMMFIVNQYTSGNTSYIFAQWHGVAATNLFRDDVGTANSECIAQLSYDDAVDICKSSCNYQSVVPNSELAGGQKNFKILREALDFRCQTAKSLSQYKQSKNYRDRTTCNKRVGCQDGEVIVRDYEEIDEAEEDGDDDDLGNGSRRNMPTRRKNTIPEIERVIGTGLHYEQGGYPPLIFALKYGYYFILARSDSRKFIKKSGCALPDVNLIIEGKICDDESRKYAGSMYKSSLKYNGPKINFKKIYECPCGNDIFTRQHQKSILLWHMPVNQLTDLKWHDFTWHIKWAEYKNGFANPIKNGEIKVWLNNQMIVDFVGPVGRNDQRSPYFKAGIYNPGASGKPVTTYFTNYQHLVNGKKFDSSNKNISDFLPNLRLQRAHLNVREDVFKKKKNKRDKYVKDHDEFVFRSENPNLCKLEQTQDLFGFLRSRVKKLEYALISKNDY